MLQYKTPAHTIDVQSATNAISQLSRQYTSLILVDPGHKVIEANYRDLMLFQQFLPAMCQISGGIQILVLLLVIGLLIEIRLSYQISPV